MIKVSALIVSLLLLVAVAAMVWNYGYIDEEITMGEGYGFRIGDSKDEVIDGLQKANGASYMAVQVGNDPKEFKVIKLDQLYNSNIDQYNSWLILIDSEESFLNTVRLDFHNSKLVRIYRHKKMFELP